MPTEAALREIARKITDPATGFPHPSQAEEDHRREVDAPGEATGRWTGHSPSRWRSARFSPTAFPSGSAARTAPGGHSPSATWSGGTRKPGCRSRTRPSTHVPPTEIQFSVYDSPLSEYSILGFEYGFTLGTAPGPGDVGGPVRRFLQRRAGDHRQLRGRRRGEMGNGERHRPAAAARIRGPGARAFQRSPREVPPPVRAGQHPGGQLHHPRAVLPPPAAAGPAHAAQAARRDDSQEPPAASRARSPRSRTSRRAHSRRCWTIPAAEEGRGGSLLCSGKIYYELAVAARRGEGHDDRPSCASSSCTRSRRSGWQRSSRRYPGINRDALGAGRAAQPRRLVLHAGDVRPLVPAHARSRTSAGRRAPAPPRAPTSRHEREQRRSSRRHSQQARASYRRSPAAARWRRPPESEDGE